MGNENDAIETWPGSAYPLGATHDGSGTNFAIFSESAEAVELCLFDEDRVETRVPLVEIDAFVWHAYLPGVGPGQRYGYRAHGAYAPENGQRSNPAKLLLDPYAKATTGDFQWNQSLFSYDFDDPEQRNDEDSAASMMLGVVVDDEFDWGDDTHPRIPYNRTVIYEAHVKGLTQLHPDVPEADRGTYSGVAHPAVIEHLQRIGVTAIELMPVHAVRARTRCSSASAASPTTGATTRSASSRRTTATPRWRRARRAGRRVQVDGSRAARGRHRGHPRRRLQPHRRGQPPRDRRSPSSGIDNLFLLPAVCRTTSATTTI
jgi:pullulanase/glycogen debranching enzyme